MECYQRIDSSNATLTEMIQTTNDKNKEQDAALQQTKIDLDKANTDVHAFEGTTTASISQINGTNS